jgi:hypothetical protein
MKLLVSDFLVKDNGQRKALLALNDCPVRSRWFQDQKATQLHRRSLVCTEVAADPNRVSPLVGAPNSFGSVSVQNQSDPLSSRNSRAAPPAGPLQLVRLLTWEFQYEEDDKRD